MSGQWLVWWSMAGFTERRKGINWTLDRHGASTKYPSSPLVGQSSAKEERAAKKHHKNDEMILVMGYSRKLSKIVLYCFDALSNHLFP